MSLPQFGADPPTELYVDAAYVSAARATTETLKERMQQRNAIEGTISELPKNEEPASRYTAARP